MESENKLCVECKHHDMELEKHICRRVAIGDDVVVGFHKLYNDCYSERRFMFDEHSCNKTGQFWESR